MLNQKEFLARFSNSRFRYIHEVNKEVVQGTNVLDLSWNDKGYGVYFTVNGFPSSGEATISNLISLNCNFIDIDIKDDHLSQDERDRMIQEKIMRAYEEGFLMPTFIVRTKNGVHLYWVYSVPILSPSNEQKLQWSNVQNRLVKYFDADKNAKDLARVLRVPYTKHLKNPLEPYEITIQSYKPENIYTLEGLYEVIPGYDEQNLTENKTSAIELLSHGVPVGKGLRHAALAQVAGLLLRDANTPEKIATARLNYYAWDKYIVKSPESFESRKKELDDTFDGISKVSLSNRNNNFKKTDIKNNKSVALTRCLEDIESIPISWLWEGRIALGKLFMLAGDPGLGKSLITANLATSVSMGYPWPVDNVNAPTGDVILLSAEDDPGDTIKPRLEAMGADCRRIHIIEAIQRVEDRDDQPTKHMFSFKRDLEALGDLLTTLPNCKLVIIDPVSAYLDNTDSNNNSDIRGLLAPLAELASKHNVAIVLVSHLNKNSGGVASYRVMGSLAFTAAVRAAFIVSKDPNDPKRRLMMPLKNNLAKDTTGLAYSITEVNGAPTVAWEPNPVEMTADEVLAKPESNSEPTATEEAINVLNFILINGPIRADVAIKEAKQAGVKEKPLRLAREKLGVKTTKVGFKPGYWIWELPEDAQNTEGASSKQEGILVEGGHLQ